MDIPTTVVDVEDGPAVDVTGDATEAAVLREAGIDDARTVILALDDDIIALVATFVIHEIEPEIEIIVRANRAEGVSKLYYAGADHVLSLAAVSARLVASAIIRSGPVVTFDKRVRLVRKSAAPFAGRRLDSLRLHERTGSILVVVQHGDGRLNTNADPTLELGKQDQFILAGTDHDIDRFDDWAANRTPTAE